MSVLTTKQAGVLQVNGIEVRYLTPAELQIPDNKLFYSDVYGLMDILTNLTHDKVSSRWDPPNILISGHKGNGKSLLAAYFAQQYRIPYLSMDCSEDTRERHFRGGFVVRDGSTPFVLGSMANAIQAANEFGAAMIVLEEINALSPQMQKNLNAQTDFRKKIEIPELGWRLELAPQASLFVIGTSNPVVYGGTYELNEDLKSRFLEIELPYPPQAAEKHIIKSQLGAAQIEDKLLDELIQIATETRQNETGYALSPRDLVQLARLVPRLGWEGTLFMLGQKFSPEDRKVVASRIRDITRVSVSETLNVGPKWM